VPFASRIVADSCTFVPTLTLLDGGVTVTVATGAGGGAFTVTDAVPVFPSLVAVIVTPPATSPLTSPVPDTDATALFDELHVTVRPVSVAPDASRVTTESWTVPPTFTELVPGLTTTVATGAGSAFIVTDAVPLLPSLVAVIVTVPAPNVETSPLADTVASDVFEELQVTVRPDSCAPLASRIVAVSCTAVPTLTVLDEGETVTVATGAGGGALTVIDAVPLLPSLVAVIVAAPAATAVTSPLLETVA
jgi:hypothetical protein